MTIIFLPGWLPVHLYQTLVTMDDFCSSPFMDANLTWSESSPYFTYCFEETAVLWTPFAVLLSSCMIQFLFQSDVQKYKNRSTNYNLQYLQVAVYCSLVLVALSPFYLNISQGWHLRLTHRLTMVAVLTRVTGYTVVFGLRLLCNQTGRMYYKTEILFWITTLLSEGILFRTAVARKSHLEDNETNKDMVTESYNVRLVLFPLVITENVLLLLEKCLSMCSKEEKQKHKLFKLSVFNIWLDKLFWQSYWNENGTKPLADTIEINRKYVELPTKSTASFSIFGIFCNRFGKQFIVCGIQRLCQELLGFAAPEILRLFLAYLSGTNTVYTWKDYFFVLIITCTLFARNCFGLFYWKNVTAISIKFRSLLNTAVMQKSLRKQTLGTKDTKSTLLNILGADSQKLFDVIPLLHTLWVAPAQLIIAAYLLYNIFGVAAMAGSCVIISIILLTVIISKRIRRLQVKQMNMKDSRINTTTETINSLKVIKLQGWENVFIQRIDSARNPELKYIKKSLVYFSMMVCTFTVAPIIVLLFPLTIYLLTDTGSDGISAEDMFIALTIVNIVTIPLLSIPSLAVLLAQSAVSIRRINKFMNSKEEDTNLVGPDQEQGELSVVFNNVWASSIETQTHILKNLNFKIPKGSLVAIVGDSGSGKSCLLRTILGELNIVLGNVTINGSTAFTPEMAWLRNGTIKENILFYKEFNPDIYYKLLNACRLTDDLNNLSGSDQTVLQNNGSNLSGGQKQRISLCRAAYSNSDIYLFDNPMSAIDSKTADEVYSMLISPVGILNKTTRFVVSNDFKLQKDADIILKIENQTVSISNRDLVSQCLMPTDKWVQTSACDTGGFCVDKINIIDQHQYTPKQFGAASSSKHYITQGGLFELILGLVLTFGSAAAYTFSNIWLSKWTSKGTQEQEENVIQRLIVYGGAGFVQATLLLLGCHFLFKFALNASRNLHFQATSGIINTKIIAFNNVGTGSLLNVLSKDIDILDSNLPQNVQGVVLNILLLLSGVFTICYATPVFLTIAIPVGLVYAVIQRFYVVTSTKLRRHEASTRSEMYSKVIETLEGISVIKAFNVEKESMDAIQYKACINNEAQFLYSAGTLWIKARLDVLGCLIVMSASIFAVAAKANLDVSVSALSLSSALQITQLLNYFIKLTCDLESNMVAVERVLAVTELPQENMEVYKKSDFIEGQALTAWPQTGDIVFNDVEIQYMNDAQPALSIPQFSIRSKQKIGILGKTGAGKSTLLLTLFRLLEPSRGVISIFGRDISKIPVADLKSKIAIVPQEPTFFSGTLRFNIDPANIYTDAEIWDVLGVVNLQKYVNLQALGLHSPVTSEGSKISAGYKQLFCLARALLKKCNILVLDEATSNCDPEIERSIQKIVKERFVNSTVLIIAHRINVVLDCDRIVVFKDGKIIETDTVENLISNKSSYFYQVVHSNPESPIY